MPKLSQKRIDLVAAIERVTDLPPAELTLAELVSARALARCDDLDVRLRKWTDAYGSLSAWTLTSEQVQTAADAMLDHGYKPSAINRDVSALGTVYRWAKEQRLAPKGFRSPTLDVRRFDEPIRVKHVQADKIAALRARALAFRDRRFGVYVALLVDTGARKGELLQRRWSDVNLDACEIHVSRTKNGQPRVLFFRPETAILIKRAFPTRRADDLVFEGRVPGQPVDYKVAWAKLVADVGLEDFHQHDVRHVAAANLLKAGNTLPVAAQVLGHDPAVLARRYGHLETGPLKYAQQQAWALNS